ncbi:MAG: hypothetical protein PUK41_07340 [Campylobacter hominis]|uniref:hypothetical protein n=1 Tax=Campylobacter hominis TaxID=76517 RepID=UPI0023F4F894|nr:hypothetical protein [Campylobacter hominis]MDD7423153.1 hypothetical protein [Campylobacter hominis]
MEKLKENQEIDIENLKFENDENLEKELLEKYDIKLDSDESVFYKFTCHSKFWLFVELLTCLIGIIGSCGVIVTETILYKILSIFLLLILLCHALPNWIKKFIYKGFYITNKRLITFNGKSFLLENLYFMIDGWGSSTLDFYENKNFIQNTSVRKRNELDKFVLALFYISQNRAILNYGSDGINKYAINIDDRNKIKLINN